MNPVTFKSREDEIGHAVEQATKKSCKIGMSEERTDAIKKSVKADEQGCINIPAHMTWVGKHGERDITRQLVMLQSWV